MTTDHQRSTPIDPECRRTFFSVFTGLLHPVDLPEEEQVAPAPGQAAKLLCVAVMATVAYGVAAGTFQGDGQILVTALKAPLILLGSVLLCVPSLYVLTSLGGTVYRRMEFLHAVIGFCGVIGWVFLALLPVVWLFSVGSRSLFFMVFLHFLAWTGAALTGRRYLLRVIPGARRGVLSLWCFLLVLVSLQMATQFRPVLWRQANQPLFTTAKQSFTEQLGVVLDIDEKTPSKGRTQDDNSTGAPGNTDSGR